MHDGMPSDPIQGQGHACLKATQEESTVSPAWDLFYIIAILHNSNQTYTIWYWDSAGSTVEENSSVFSLIRMR